MGDKFIFLDRDGTLIRDIPYLGDPDCIELLENAVNGLVLLQELKFRFGIITNQSGIDRGIVTLEDVKSVNSRLCAKFAVFNVFFDFVFFCPHTPSTNCLCRKPHIELGRQAIENFDVDVSSSFMIGDKDSDMEFGANLNLNTVRIKSNYPCNFSSTHVAADLLEAAEWIDSIDES